MASIQSPANPVVAAVDLQPNSRQVLLRARALASEKQLPLVVLHVAHESAESAGFYRRHVRRNDTTPIRDIAEELLHELVEDVLGTTGNGSEAEGIRTLVVEGIPGSRIVEVAEREDASSIVMSCCGLQGFARWWRGSVATYVETHAGCEVVVLTERAELAPIDVGKQQTQPLHASH
jgi:nucleotide-binding universal stress UspA family protein